MGNLAKGSPLIKKLIFFVSYLTRADTYRSTRNQEGEQGSRRKIEAFMFSLKQKIE